MSSSRLLIATRNPDKLREIREILSGSAPLDMAGLVDLGISKHPGEEDLERFDSFEANALAKARYFSRRSGLWTLADDSGLCVDALGGAPGVHSKRFAAAGGLTDQKLDRANNALLLERLQGRALSERSARYVCAVAWIGLDHREQVFTGTCEGVILPEARGEGGFGYDPLFFIPEEGATFGQLPARSKNRISHRARALRAAGDVLRGPVDAGQVGR